MGEKPILFNSDMVRAILDGRKTQTRQIVRGIPLYEPYFENYDGHPIACDEYGEWFPLEKFSRIQPDDVLYVREAFCELPVMPNGESSGKTTFVYYMADGDLRPAEYQDLRWNPSIFMPKGAARLFLRVTDVRAKRLQDMTEDDAYASGYMGCHSQYSVLSVDGRIEPCHVGGDDCPLGSWYCNHSTQEGFGRDIWDNVIKPVDRARYGWDANPWVYVITFEKIEKPRGLRN